MRPKVAVPSDVPGSPQFGWFRALKNSARNCSEIGSRIGNTFPAEISAFHKPGPKIEFWPALPSAYLSGNTYALVSKNCASVRSERGRIAALDWVHRRLLQILSAVACNHPAEKLTRSGVAGSELNEGVPAPGTAERVHPACSDKTAEFSERHIAIAAYRGASDARGRAVQDDAGKQVRLDRCKARRDTGSLRHADDRNMFQREMSAQRLHIGDVVGQGRAARR